MGVILDDGDRRRLKELLDRVEDLEDERLAIKELPDAVAHLAGQVEVLQALVLAQSQKVNDATGLKTALQFAAVIIVPLIVVLVGGYFTLRAAGLNVAPGAGP